MTSASGRIALFFMLLIYFPSASFGQDEKKERKGEFYFSWGYNTEWYTNCNVYVSQPSLGNEYTLENVQAHDHRGWDEGLFTKQLTIPQYNYRFGYFFNKEKGLGVEINFDHTKYIISDQQVHITGKINSGETNMLVNFNGDNGFYYYLNNGANFLLFNFVKRWNWVKSKNHNERIKVDLLGKAGVGPVIPHVENSFFGQANEPHFQLGGWNVGIEAALRATFYKYVYLEYTNKLDYAHYSGLRIYEGTASQAFGTYEMILNLGITFPVGKRAEEVKK